MKNRDRKLEKFAVGTCFDSVITGKLNERLPESVPYLTQKDIEPKKVMNEEMK